MEVDIQPQPAHSSHRLTMGMETIGRFLRRIRYSVFSSRRADDLAAELEAHRAAVQARLESDGVPGDEAAERSRRAMGRA